MKKSFVILLVQKGNNYETFYIYVIFSYILSMYNFCAFYLQDIFLKETLCRKYQLWNVSISTI